MNVAVANTVVDKNAVVVRLGNTVFTNTAMLRPCRLEQLTRPTVRSRVKQRKIERILCHLQLVVLRGDVAGVTGCGEPEEDVRTSDGHDSNESLGGGQERPCGRDEHVFTTREQGQEEDENCRMPVVQHVVAETAQKHA